MQEDFHFYTIYVLSRSAGFDESNARIVAYSSQHTDDAKHGHAIEFINGGRFSQTMTAHRFLDLDSIKKDICYKIWMPFHFLPGNLGVDFYERMITRPNSPVARKMIDDLLGSSLKAYSLHLLGIILHVYADTWSHQDFIGLIHDMNDIRDIRVEGEQESFIEGLLEKLKMEILEYAAPNLGHAQAGTIPDEPFRTWEYTDWSGRRKFRQNTHVVLDASQNCYMLLLSFIDKFEKFRVRRAIKWEDLIQVLDELFSEKGDLNHRIKLWQDAIKEGRFGFEPGKGDMSLSYDDREWFKEAVRVIVDDEEKKFERRPGFEVSNWKYFHDGAVYHRFHILHELLPQYGIICG